MFRPLFVLLLTTFTFVSSGLCLPSYKGSHAYNQVSHANASVNTATGTLHFSYPIIETSGIHVPFKINLTYQFNSKGVFGLPDGWQLDINYISSGMAVLGGQQWLIDPLWHDEHLFSSGLKYYNQHGTMFRDENAERPIPAYPTMSYRYRAMHKDGSVNYFSAQGLMVLQVDRFGNRVIIEYEQPAQSIEEARLSAIIDNYGNRYTFVYEPGTLIARYPDGREQYVYFSEHGVTAIVDLMQQRYELSYISRQNYPLIKTINTPFGLITDLEYGTIPCKRDGIDSQLPVVNHFRQYESETKKLHYETYYSYIKNNNYTGYPLYEISKESDSLIDSNNQNYRYVVEVKQTNGDSEKQTIHHKVYEYNYLHLPLEIRTIKDGKEFQKTELTYSIDTFKYSRSTNYDKPTKVVHFTWNEKEKKYIPGNRIEHQYDLFGNNTIKKYWIYNRQNKSWRHINTIQHQYFTNYYSLLYQTINKEMASDKVLRTRYYLSSSKKTYCAKMTHTLKHGKKSNQWQPWQQIDYQHDEKGREIFRQLKWIVKGMPGVVKTHKKTHYIFDKNSGHLTTRHESSLGSVIQKQTDTRSKQLLSEVSALGEKTEYRYNKLGQLTHRIDPEGNIRTFKHYYYAKDGLNATVSISPLGFRQRVRKDASERLVMHEEEVNGQYQVIEQKEYNAFGKIATHKDKYGQLTEFKYDDQMRVIESTDPWLNKITVIYDDDNLSQQIFHNGKKYKQIEKVPWLLTVKTTNYPIGNEHNQMAVENKVIKNGFNMVLSEESALLEMHTLKNLSVIKNHYEYDPSHNRVKIETKGFDGLWQKKESYFDLFNNVHTFVKQQVHKGQYSFHLGDQYFYNSDNQLERVVSPKEKNTKQLVFSHKYDKNGREIEHNLPNGRSIKKSYTSIGLLKSVSWNRKDKLYQVHYKYDSDRRLVEISDSQGQQQSYQYDLNGNLISLVYPDKHQQKYWYDRLSRVIRQENAGTKRSIIYQYDDKDKGKLSFVRNNGNQINYVYGKDSNGTLGRLIMIKRELEGSGKTKEHYSYGSFDRLIKSEVYTDDGLLLFSNNYQYLPRGELIKQTNISWEKGKKISSETIDYTYDAFKRLTKEKHLVKNSGKSSATLNSEVSYQYDGNNNLILEQRTEVNGEKKITKFDYNIMNQLISIKKNKAQQAVITHDSIGHMVIDHEGKKYQYDDLGLLQHSTDKNGKVLASFNYLPNGLLGQIHDDKEKHNFYYDLENKAISVVKNHSHYDLVQHKGNYLLQLTEKGGAQLFIANKSIGAQLNSNNKGEQGATVYSYEGYGQSKRLNNSAVQSTGDFLWNQELVEKKTGLVYLKTRFYHPNIKRFISRDHLKVDNRYSYAHANPILFIDPTGQSSHSLGNMGVGSIFLALSFFTVLASLPTAGVSLSLASVFGLMAGVSELASCIALMSAQSVLNSGNKVLGHALQYTGMALGGMGAIVSLGASVAPVANALGFESPLIARFLRPVWRSKAIADELTSSSAQAEIIEPASTGTSSDWDFDAKTALRGVPRSETNGPSRLINENSPLLGVENGSIANTPTDYIQTDETTRNTIKMQFENSAEFYRIEKNFKVFHDFYKLGKQFDNPNLLTRASVARITESGVSDFSTSGEEVSAQIHRVPVKTGSASLLRSMRLSNSMPELNNLNHE